MGTVSVHFAAIWYLDQWFVTEEPIRTALLSGAREEQRRALTKAAPFFNVARNLQRKYDVGRGRERYDPVVDAIQTLPPVAPNDPDELVLNLAENLSASYGDRGTLSIASKILWLRYQDPVVIYDSRALRTLRARADDYPAYRQSWEHRWDKEQADIAGACAELFSVARYAECGSRVAVDDIRRVCGCTWFQRRVLDIKLWFEGERPVAHHP